MSDVVALWLLREAGQKGTPLLGRVLGARLPEAARAVGIIRGEVVA